MGVEKILEHDDAFKLGLDIKQFVLMNRNGKPEIAHRLCANRKSDLYLGVAYQLEDLGERDKAVEYYSLARDCSQKRASRTTRPDAETLITLCLAYTQLESHGVQDKEKKDECVRAVNREYRRLERSEKDKDVLSRKRIEKLYGLIFGK